MTLVGRKYITGPADRPYTKGDPDFHIFTVVSDTSEYPCHVTVKTGGGQLIQVPAKLVADVVVPEDFDV